MSNRKIYSVNSDGKVSGSTSDFNFTLPNHPHDNKFNKMSLLSCMLSKSYYTIDSTNNTLILNESLNAVGPLTVTLPTGYYDKIQLLFYLEKSLETASISGGNALKYTVTYSKLTYKLTITENAGNSFNLTPQSKSLSDITGLSQQINLSMFNTLLAPNIINLQRYSELQIHCSLASNYNNDILFSVFPSSHPTSDITYTTSDPLATSVDLTNNKTNMLHITVTDQNGSVVDLLNQDIKLILLMWEEKNDA